jgi:hypothetical protein
MHEVGAGRKDSTLSGGGGMASEYVKLYDGYILKPIWIIIVLAAALYFVLGIWILGCFLFITWYLISVISKALKADPPPLEPVQGAISPQPSSETASQGLTQVDSFIITRATFKISRLLGLTATVLLWYHAVQWYYAIALGILAGFAFKTVILLYATSLFRWKLQNIKNINA